MANFFSQSIWSIRKFAVQVLSGLLQRLSVPQQQPVLEAEIQMEQVSQVQEVELQPEKARKPVLRIQAHQQGILVSCSSCGIVHRLEAVCFSCGKPVCRDKHCHSLIQNYQLGRHVVVCKACENLS